VAQEAMNNIQKVCYSILDANFSWMESNGVKKEDKKFLTIVSGPGKLQRASSQLV
jgi:hypothetical protein